MAVNEIEEQENIPSIVRTGDQTAAATRQLVDRFASAASSDPGLGDEFSDFLPRWERAKRAALAAKDSWFPSFLSGLRSSYDDLLAVAHQGSALYQRAAELARAAGHVTAARSYPVPGRALGTVGRLQSALNAMRVPPPNAPLKVDDILGKETRKAILWFQSGHGLPQTGQADRATLNALSIAVGEGPMDAAGEASMHGWMIPFAGGAASTAGLAAAYHAWKHYRGAHAPTVAAVPGVPSSAAAAAAVHGEFGIDVFADLSHDPSAVAKAQQELNQIGYRLAVDGGLGRQTARALASFQQGRGMAPTGKLDVVTSSFLELVSMGVNPTINGEEDDVGFEWVPYALGVATLPALSSVRQYVHNMTGGTPAHMRVAGEWMSDSESTGGPGGDADHGFEWIPYALGVATLPALSSIRQYVHSATGGSRMAGEEDVPEPWELAPQPWELESTPTEDILFGDTMMSLPADNLGRTRL